MAFAAVIISSFLFSSILVEASVSSGDKNCLLLTDEGSLPFQEEDLQSSALIAKRMEQIAKKMVIVLNLHYEDKHNFQKEFR